MKNYYVALLLLSVIFVAGCVTSTGGEEEYNDEALSVMVDAPQRVIPDLDAEIRFTLGHNLDKEFYQKQLEKLLQ